MTKTPRVETPRIRPGDHLLTIDGPAGEVTPAREKKLHGAVVRVVQDKTFGVYRATGYLGPSVRCYTVYFTDGTKASDLVPSVSWRKVTDEESRVKELVAHHWPSD